MPIRHYILDKHHIAVRVDDLILWAMWMEDSNRSVKQSKIDGVEVSTVFLGLDHNWGPGPPILFETMIFGGPLDGSQWRCGTYAQALAMHQRAYSDCFGDRSPPLPKDESENRS